MVRNVYHSKSSYHRLWEKKDQSDWDCCVTGSVCVFIRGVRGQRSGWVAPPKTSGTFTTVWPKRRAGERGAPSSCCSSTTSSTCSQVRPRGHLRHTWDTEQGQDRAPELKVSKHLIHRNGKNLSLISSVVAKWGGLNTFWIVGLSGVNRAVDLCAAPGSWSQVLSRKLRF